MVKRLKITFNKWMADPEIKKHFDKDYKNFVLSESTKKIEVKNCLKLLK